LKGRRENKLQSMSNGWIVRKQAENGKTSIVEKVLEFEKYLPLRKVEKT
jgi:hypothetical protein